MLESLASALQMVFTFEAMLCLVAGTFLGVVVGALPGLGSILGITLCLPFTFGMSNAAAISLLLGVYAGSVYGVHIRRPGQHSGHASVCGDNL